MAEKLCLQWNDFKKNTLSVLGRLRKDNDFADVTLVCEDGQQIEAHKVILSASSPFFQSLLKKNKHPHPLVYMRGVNSEELVAIVDFLYRGEANVYQESLDRFLVIAEELQLEGLTGQSLNGTGEQTNYVPDTENELRSNYRELDLKYPTPTPPNLDRITIGTENPAQNGILALLNSNSSELEALNEQTDILMEKNLAKNSSNGKTTYKCKVCGKEAFHKNDLRKHIEANHLEGVSIPCSQCEKTFRSRNALARHILHNHKDRF